jgi:hypothetical protein
MSLAAIVDTRNRIAARDLAEEQPWDLSLGRSRARRDGKARLRVGRAVSTYSQASYQLSRPVG